MPHTILVTAPKIGAAGVRRLEEAGCRILYLTGSKDAAEVASLLATHPIDAVISRTLDLTEAAMRACPTLKVVCKHGVGVSNIDMAGATRLGIPVYVTPGANSQSVAELTICIMIAAARRVGYMDRELRAGRWTRAEDGSQLSGRTLGIVGLGQIGKRTAVIAMAMGMKVVAVDPLYPGTSPLAGVTMLPGLEDLLRQSNVVSLHVPLTPETRRMIGRAQIDLMPPRSILVNTARGPVVDESELAAALREGRLFAAALDTPTDEPIKPGSPLLSLDNIVLTPHMGGSTPDALEAVSAIAAENILGFLDGRRPDDAWCFNPEVLRT
jgi:D-3-phosphoglycerate dehydrogenase / 2-oxoglutarate reductase